MRAVSQPALGKLRPRRLGRVFGRERLFAQLDATAPAFARGRRPARRARLRVPLLHAGIAAALTELPERVRVIALSRNDTQRLVSLHGRDWRADRLRQLTDGWAAAMILLLATRTDLGLDDSLRSGTVAMSVAISGDARTGGPACMFQTRPARLEFDRR